MSKPDWMAGLRTTTFTYEDGTTTTVYRMRPEEHGPVYVRRNGEPALMYEWWSYIVIWYERTRECEIFIGNVNHPELWQLVTKPSMSIRFQAHEFAQWCREWVTREVRRWNLDG